MLSASDHSLAGARAEQVTRALAFLHAALDALDALGSAPHLGARLDHLIEDLKGWHAEHLVDEALSG